MKALSIRQPWAWLIVNGYKDIENRKWKTNHRGKFLIHAAIIIDEDAVSNFRQFRKDIPLPTAFETGGIVGMAEITNCVELSASPWFQGPYGFELKNADTLPFKPYKGRLNFFPCEYEGL